MSVSNVKDGLSAIANEVLEDVRKEAEALVTAAEKEAKEILRAAKEEADKNYLTITDQAKAKAEAEKRRISSLTEIEARNQLLLTKEAVVDMAFDKAQEELITFASTKEYNAYLWKLIEKIAKRMPSKKLVLFVNDKDKAWLAQGNLTQLTKRLQLDLDLSDRTENCIGGCRIETADGKVSYDSTFENRLNELKSVLRLAVAKILFTEET